MKNIRIEIFGHVQRVGFRNSARQQARYLGIKGWVKNTSDGSVLIEAEGNQTALNNFIMWCRKGPSMANVESIKTHEGEIKNYSTFETFY